MTEIRLLWNQPVLVRCTPTNTSGRHMADSDTVAAGGRSPVALPVGRSGLRERLRKATIVAGGELRPAPWHDQQPDGEALGGDGAIGEAGEFETAWSKLADFMSQVRVQPGKAVTLEQAAGAATGRGCRCASAPCAWLRDDSTFVALRL